MKRVILLTGDELRHDFFRKYLSLGKGYVVVKSFCEHTAGMLENTISPDQVGGLRFRHLQMRKQSEIDFFKIFCDTVEYKSVSQTIAYGEINSEEKVAEIIQLEPDLIVSFGCSIIKSTLIDLFEDRFINVHLGLSPYYRGAGTNFWPFVNREPEYAGVTFMLIDGGIDTGRIIHQIPAEIHDGDSIHQIGNRLIANMAKECKRLIQHYDYLEPASFQPMVGNGKEKIYRKKDFTEDAVAKLYRNFESGMIQNYLEECARGERKVNIVENSGFYQFSI